MNTDYESKVRMAAMKVASDGKKNNIKSIMATLRRCYDAGFKDGAGISANPDQNYICGNCGGELNKTIEARFCYHCGAELDFSQIEDWKDKE